MTRRRRCAAAVAGIALALAGVVVGGAAPAGAAELQDAGWWWRANPGEASVTPPGLPGAGLPAGAPETPAPPDVPEGGLLVERAPDGANAIAAIRFDLGDDASTPVLELQASDAQGTPELVACPAGSVWSGPEGAGRWDSRPSASCDPDDGGTSVTGQEGDEGAWTFDLGMLVDDAGGLDIVIVPAPAEAGVAAPFRVAFEPVSATSVRTTPGSGDFSFDGGSFSGDFGGDFGSATGDLGGGGTAGLDLGAGPSMPDLATPALDTPAGSSTGSPAASDPLAVSSPSLPDDSGATTAALAVIALGAAVMYAAVRRPVPALQSLVPLRAVRRAAPEAEPHVGGLGRFARPRTRAPIRLG